MKMRKGMWFATLGLALVLTAPALAQQDMGSFFTGVHPSDIKYKPVDVSKAIAPVPRPGTTDTFSFRRYLSKMIPGLSPTPPTTISPPLPAVPMIPNASVLPVMKRIAPGPVIPTTAKR
jgi:hypothetical protein